MRKKRGKKVGGVLILVVLLLMFVAASFAYAQKPKYEFAFVNYCTTTAFWIPVRQGAKDAAEMVGAEVYFTGTPGFDMPELVAVLENVLESGCDGVSACIADPKAFDDVFQRFLDRGIPVVSHSNSDNTTPNPRMAFIGQDPFPAGKSAGVELVKYLKKNAKVCILIESPGPLVLEERIRGIKEVLAENGVNFEVLDTTTDRVQAAANIESYYLGNPDVDAFICVDTTGTPVAAELMKREGLTGEVVIAGFDLTSDTIQGIVDGSITFTVDQQPYLQGFLPILELYLYKEYGIMPVDVATGAAIVDKTNVMMVKNLAEKGYR